MKNSEIGTPSRTRSGPCWPRAILLILVFILFKTVKVSDRLDFQKRSLSFSVSVADFSFKFGLNNKQGLETLDHVKK